MSILRRHQHGNMLSRIRVKRRCSKFSGANCARRSDARLATTSLTPSTKLLRLMFLCRPKGLNVPSLKLWNNSLALTNWPKTISTCVQFASRSKMQRSLCQFSKRLASWLRQWSASIFLGGKSIGISSTLILSTWRNTCTRLWTILIMFRSCQMRFTICMAFVCIVASLQVVVITIAIAGMAEKAPGSNAMIASSRKHLNRMLWARKLISCSIRSVLPKKLAIHQARKWSIPPMKRAPQLIRHLVMLRKWRVLRLRLKSLS
jgi:hypothetical protein